MWWTGQLLTGTARQPIAFDTETRLIEDELKVPELALGMAYDGKTAVLIHPSKMAEFLAVHERQHLVIHNAAFDFWVCEASAFPQRCIWNAVNANRWHDTMILDMLIQLATGDYRADIRGNVRKELMPANLAVLSAETGGVELNKADPYRIRYGELIGLSEAEIEAHPEFEGFKSYAINDVIALWPIYPKLYDRAVQLMKEAGWKATAKTYRIRPDALAKFGPLSEAIQVKGAIALAHVSRQPLCIDQPKREALENAYKAEIAEGVAVMDAYAKEKLVGKGTELFITTKAPKRKKPNAGENQTYGHMIPGKKRGLPKMSLKALAVLLEGIATEIGQPVLYSTGKKRGVSTSTKQWIVYADKHPFIKAWTRVTFLADRVKFLSSLHDGKVYSRYEFLKVTGRTSARKWAALPGLNIQQVPKEDDLRALFRASADDSQKLIACDWSAVELVTLSSTCKAMFGSSVMGDAITAGEDLHVRTAQSILNATPVDWSSLDEKIRKDTRQASKCVNFGFPGGLGIKRFVSYAAQPPYSLQINEDDAKRFKKAWLAAYPEMRQYLSDVTPEALQRTLKIHPKDTERLFGHRLFRLGEALSGDYDADDEETVAEMSNLFKMLQSRAKGTRFYPLFLGGPSEHLKEKILGAEACTLTGRVRADCGFTEGKNSPFQGLAADGAKLALWDLLFIGKDVRAFVHDEILVASSVENALTTEKQVVRLMCKAMDEVTGQGVPATAKASVDFVWRK